MSMGSDNDFESAKQIFRRLDLLHLHAEGTVQHYGVHVEDADWLFIVSKETVLNAVSLQVNTVKTTCHFSGVEIPGYFLRDGHLLFSALLCSPMKDITSCFILTF